jgi:hypothetical protein
MIKLWAPLLLLLMVSEIQAQRKINAAEIFQEGYDNISFQRLSRSSIFIPITASKWIWKCKYFIPLRLMFPEYSGTGKKSNFQSGGGY